MKKILLLLIGLTIISCSSDDDSSSEIDQSAKLIGSWKSNNFEAFGSDPTTNTDQGDTIDQGDTVDQFLTYYNNGTLTYSSGNYVLSYEYEVTGPGKYTSTYSNDGRQPLLLDVEYKIEGNTLTLTEPTNIGPVYPDTVISTYVKVE